MEIDYIFYSELSIHEIIKDFIDLKKEKQIHRIMT